MSFVILVVNITKYYNIISGKVAGDVRADLCAPGQLEALAKLCYPLITALIVHLKWRILANSAADPDATMWLRSDLS